MSDNIPPSNGWTLTTLYTHFASLLQAQKEAVMIAQNAAEKALEKAEMASEKRFDSVSEFRVILNEHQRTLMPRSETETRFRVLEDKIESLEKSQVAAMGRREGLSVGWSILIALAGLAGILFGIIRHIP